MLVSIQTNQFNNNIYWKKWIEFCEKNIYYISRYDFYSFPDIFKKPFFPRCKRIFVFSNCFLTIIYYKYKKYLKEIIRPFIHLSIGFLVLVRLGDQRFIRSMQKILEITNVWSLFRYLKDYMTFSFRAGSTISALKLMNISDCLLNQLSWEMLASTYSIW